MKKNKTPLTKPLSEQELDWLNDYLQDLSQTYDDCMTLEAVDGLFCALIVNPRMAKPSEWMKVVFGQEHEFKSEAQVEKVMTLLIRYWNHLSYLIQKRPQTEHDDVYIPFVLEYDEDEAESQFAQEWAVGFHAGIDYCLDDWLNAMEKDEFMTQLFGIILLLKLGYNPDNEDEIITLEKRRELFLALPAVVYTFFDYWLEKISSEKKQTKPTKVGRNDPCPCGSGKKYKKCCEGQVSATVH
jgi:uncharacterized protein